MNSEEFYGIQIVTQFAQAFGDEYSNGLLLYLQSKEISWLCCCELQHPQLGAPFLQQFAEVLQRQNGSFPPTDFQHGEKICPMPHGLEPFLKLETEADMTDFEQVPEKAFQSCTGHKPISRLVSSLYYALFSDIFQDQLI